MINLLQWYSFLSFGGNMNKVAIITIYDNKNYGNRLQNCAVHKILTDLDYEVDTIIPRPDILRRLKLWLVLYLRKKYKNDKIENLKNNNFSDFNNRNLILKKINRSILIKGKANKRYKYAFLGGDQIWGPYKQEYRIKGFSFGSCFLPEKRITMCPSFGNCDLKKEDEEFYKKYLMELRHISVREQSGADIVKRLTGRDATVVIDPVMALTVDEWKKVFDVKKFSDSDYALCCFLGGTDENIEKIISKITVDKDVFRLYDKNSPIYSEGPDGFLSLIYNAKIICTDSFHCAAFSLLFKKPLIVFDRLNIEKSQNTRLLNLLSKFRLTDRHIDNIDIENCYQCDYSEFDLILENERKIFYDFLKLSLKEDNK